MKGILDNVHGYLFTVTFVQTEPWVNRKNLLDSQTLQYHVLNVYVMCTCVKQTPV